MALKQFVSTICSPKTVFFIILKENQIIFNSYSELPKYLSSLSISNLPSIVVLHLLH